MSSTSLQQQEGGGAPPPRLVIGLDTVPWADAGAALSAARDDGYDYVTTLIPNNSTTTSSNNAVRTDVTTLGSKWWRTSVVGVVDICEQKTASDTGSTSYATTFQSALEWSLHMNLPAVLMPPLPTGTNEVQQYASALGTSLSLLRDQQVWVPVPLQALSNSDHSAFPFFHRLVDYHPAVHVVLVLEAILPTTTQDVKVHVADMLRRLHLWMGAVPIAAIALPTRIFLTNKRGFPTLSKAHQMILTALLRRVGRTVKVLVQPPPPTINNQQQHSPLKLTPDQLGPSGTLPYQQYLQHLRSSRAEITSALDSANAAMEYDYLDALQTPLQPLADHLEFQTYEVFEQDPVKYAQYQAAVLQAMSDFSATATATHSAGGTVVTRSTTSSSTDMDTTTNTESSRTFIILVVGAGRGPLVTCCLHAYEQLNNNTNVQLQVFAVEKNPSAVLYLRSKQALDWKNSPVQVVHSDLRKLNAAELFGSSTQTAHLVVSELLGSFGCNELSPECLDALFHETDVCGPRTVSIPARYTSHAAPVSSIKLHQAVKQHALYPVAADCTVTAITGITKAMETPYVVRTHAASQTHIATDCWSFVHPSAATATRDRYVHLQFPATDPTYATACGSGYGAMDEIAVAALGNCNSSTVEPLPWTCTGILGTFTADLYYSAVTNQMTQISTVPHAFSVGMFSWFPLYFPISQPVLVPAGAAVHADIWRKCDAAKVWYEWSVQVVRGSGDTAELLYASPIHNPGGRSYHVSM
jgi:type II protein arginine methyltransferase